MKFQGHVCVFSGPNCELALPCMSNPCYGESRCMANEENGGLTYQCICDEIHSGKYCEKTPCYPNPCNFNGKFILQCKVFYLVHAKFLFECYCMVVFLSSVKMLSRCSTRDEPKFNARVSVITEWCAGRKITTVNPLPIFKIRAAEHPYSGNNCDNFLFFSISSCSCVLRELGFGAGVSVRMPPAVPGPHVLTVQCVRLRTVWEPGRVCRHRGSIQVRVFQWLQRFVQINRNFLSYRGRRWEYLNGGLSK